MNKPSYEELEKQIIELKKKLLKISENEQINLHKNRFNLLLKASEDMITIHKKNGEYIYYNGPECYPISADDVVGKMPSDIFENNATNTLLETFNKVIRTGKSETIEILLDFLGEKKWYSEYIYPIKNEDGDVIEMVKVCRDIHERKMAEQKIIIQNKELKTLIEEKEKQSIELNEAKDKAEESDRLKSAFLANMSHEIRTPMNGILGFTELLKSKNITEEKKENYLNLIDKEGKRLLGFITDIIDISKIESNVISIFKTPSNINLILDDLLTKYSIKLKESNVKLLLKKGLPDTESTIETDANKLVQILSNLIENAIKFSAKGSIEFGYTLRFNQLHFFVKDTGVGIETEEQKTIFNRFTKGKNEQIHNNGAGLGLSIVKGLINILDGKIWVDSKPGIGSSFFFTIPYKKELIEQPVIIKEKVKKIDDNHFTILIAEDEFIIFMYLKECLSNFNCTVLHAANGEKTIKIFEENKTIDIVLMDINMPKLNGYEVLEKIRLKDKNIPIIAQTGLAMQGDKEKMLAAGFNDYITKPIEIKTLIDTINKNLNKNIKPKT